MWQIKYANVCCFDAISGIRWRGFVVICDIRQCVFVTIGDIRYRIFVAISGTRYRVLPQALFPAIERNVSQ